MVPVRTPVASWKGYAASLLLTLLTFALNEVLLNPLMEGRPPMLVMLLAVSLSSAYGGFGPGLFSTLVSVVLVTYMHEPYGALEVAHVYDQIRVILLAVLGIVTASLFAALQRARRKEAAAVGRLNAELADRAGIERSLSESRDEFELLASSVPEIVMVLTTDSRFEYLNLRWTEVTGLARDVGLGAGWRVAAHPDDLPRFDTRLVEAIQQNRPLEIRLRLRTRDGIYRMFLLRASPARRADGSLRWFGSATDIEDEERAAAALRVSEERFRAAVEAAELGTFEWDGDSDQVLWSQRARTLLGVETAGAMRLAELVSVLGRDAGERLRQSMQAALDRGAGQRFRTELTLSGVPTRQVLIAGLVTGNRGRAAVTPRKCVGAVLDLSRERSAAVQVEQLQASLQLAVESTRLGIWDVDLASGSVVMTPRARALYGFDAAEPVSLDAMRARIHVDDVDSYEACWHSALDPQGQGRMDIDYRVRHPDGKVLWISALGRAHFTGSGSERKAVRIAGTLLDISTRKEDENRLAAQEEQFRLAAEAIRGFIYSADLLTGRVVRTRGLYEMLGWESEEAQPTLMWWHDQLHPDDLKRYQATLQAAINRHARYISTHYRAKHRTGHWCHLSDRAVILYDDSGVAQRLVGCRQDVSDQIETMRALADADEKKDRFLAVLAHELRNPMAPLRNAVSILRTAEFQRPELLHSVEILDRQLRHASRLVDDLLDIGRIGRGALELRKSAASLADVIQSGIDTVRPVVEERGQKLRVTLALEEQAVLVDPVRIAQVIANLLSNASKFSPNGGVIELAAATLGSQVQITVQDQGKGIPPAELASIFEMFAQLDRSEPEAQEGLGIGLALSRHLVELHGGQIRAYSEGRGTGARFVITLPVEHANIDAPAASQDERARVLTIVVADDNVDSAESLSVLLTLDGHHVAIAHDGSTAARLTAENQPDLAILDLSMPGLDGYEAARRIRALPGGQSVVLVALSGYAQPEDRQRSRDAGFDLHLVKPLDPDRLRGLLAAAAGGRDLFRQAFAVA